MLEQQLELVKINAWANKKFRESLKEYYSELQSFNTPYGTFHQLVYHLFGAIYVWSKRIGYADFEIKPLDDLKTMDDMFKAWELTDQKFVEIIEKMEKENLTPDHIFKYKNKNGEMSEITLKNIVLQLNNHSYYHRGQIGFAVRLQNKTPLHQTDANVYFRENKM